MTVLYALVCEETSMRPDGRLNAGGVFHELFARGFPAMQDRMSVAIAIEWDEQEIGRKEFRIDLVDPTGTPSLTISGNTEVGPRRPAEPPQRTVILMPVEDVRFPVEGTYRFELHLDDKVVPLCPLHLIESDEVEVEHAH